LHCDSDLLRPHEERRLFVSPDIGNTIALPLFEIASVLVRLDHVARCIEKANHGMM
jgi:hypothetical protein